MAYTVTAKRWEHGWELHIDGIAMVRDPLAADDASDAETAGVTIRPDLGGIKDLVLAVRAQIEQAQNAQQEAAKA